MSKFHLGATLALLLSLASLSARASTIDEELAACLACHGANGTSVIAEVPSLGGQPEFYLAAQLVMFREQLRANEPMNSLLRSQSDETLRRMAAALAKLPPPPANGGAVAPARAARAQALVAQHRCNFCHKADFSGEQNAPRLAGQREDYLLKALRSYKDNSRRAYDVSMADVMHPLSDADLVELAHYLSRLQ